MAFTHALLLALFVAAVASAVQAQLPTPPPSKAFLDSDYFQLALNLEYLEAEFYCHSVYGYGVEGFPPSEGTNLTGGGPNSVGGKIAILSPNIRSVAEQLCLHEIGHIRIIREYLGDKAVPRPLIDIDGSWAALFSAAYKGIMKIPFDPYQNDLSWLLASYVLPYVGLTAYVGTNPNLEAVSSKKLLAGVLGVEASQDVLIRTLLYTMEGEYYYGQSVPSVTERISKLRNDMDHSGMLDDEGLKVPKQFGAEGRIMDNIISANNDSLSYARNPPETLAIVYGTGNASKPGGFWPKGANGVIAQYYLCHGT